MSFQAERLDPGQWIGAPVLACMGATLLMAMPLRLFGLQLPEPAFAMVPAFAWAVIRPSLLAPFALLGLGLFTDFLWGGPLGLWALSLLTVYAGVLVTRPMIAGQSRVVMWIWYAFMSLLAMTVGYVGSILDSGNAPSLVATFWQLAPTVLLYPFAHRLIERFEDADVRFR